MPNPAKSKRTRGRTSWEQSHLQGREEQLYFTHLSPSARCAHPSTKEIACAHRVSHGGGEWFWSLDPTFSPLRAPSVGVVFYLTSYPVWQAESNPSGQWETKENAGRLFCCQSCSVNLEEQNWGSSSTGEKSLWGEEKELALLLAFQSRNGLYLLLFRTEQSLVPWDSKEQGKGERGSTTSTALQDWESAQNWF